MARLTPRDIQEKEFGSGFRGYKEEEVDEFLDRITSSYEEIFKENIDLKEEVERLREENKKYELIGERMQAALVAAQETADDVRKNATKEAENILREAEIKAHKMVQESRDQHRELQKSLAIVKQIEEEFRFKLKSTLQSYLKLLEEVALGDNKEVKQWILPEDMAALGERRRTMEEQESPAKKPVEAQKEEAQKPVEAKPEEKKAEAKKPEEKAEAEKPEAQKAEAQKAETTQPPAKVEEKPEAPASAEATAGKQKAETTQPPAKTAGDTGPVKVEEKKPEVAKEAIVEESKAKAAALLDEIAAQAAEEKKAEEVKEAQKEIAQKAEAQKAEAQKAEAQKVEAQKAEEAKVPFDQDAGKASAVSAEWEKLQEAVDEAVKATDKPTKAEKEAKASESTMPGEMIEPKQAASTMKTAEPEQAAKVPDAAKTTEDEPKAKVENKEAKTGKTALEDIEIVEDESFWKDI